MSYETRRQPLNLNSIELTSREVERFWAKVDRSAGSTGCWPWTGARMPTRFPYGQFQLRYNTVYTHRLSFVIHHGPIPAGQMVCHRCDNPPCVNPDHIFAGTDADNVHDMIRKGRAVPIAPRRGRDNNRTRLSENQVLSIRRRFAAGEYQTRLAAEYGITQTNVSSIVLRKTWTHLPEEVSR